MKPKYDNRFIQRDLERYDEFECWSDEDRYEPEPGWIKYLAASIAAGLLLGAIYVLFGDFGWGGK